METKSPLASPVSNYCLKTAPNSDLNCNESAVFWNLMFNACVARYLQEIGYTDTVIDVRAARVRQLLGLPVDEQDETPVTHAQRVPTKDKRPNEGPDRR